MDAYCNFAVFCDDTLYPTLVFRQIDLHLELDGFCDRRNRSCFFQQVYWEPFFAAEPNAVGSHPFHHHFFNSLVRRGSSELLRKASTRTLSWKQRARLFADEDSYSVQFLGEDIVKINKEDAHWISSICDMLWSWRISTKGIGWSCLEMFGFPRFAHAKSDDPCAEWVTEEP